MSFFNPTTTLLPGINEVLSSSKGSVLVFDDPLGIAHSPEELRQSGSLFFSPSLVISSSQSGSIYIGEDIVIGGAPATFDYPIYVSGSSLSNDESIFVFDVTVSGTLKSLSTIETQDLVVANNLTVNGTTTTIDTQNLVVEDPLVLLASNSTTLNQNGGLAILSGSSVSNESLVVGRVDTDMWGVGRMDVQSGAVTDLSGMTSVDFKAADLVSTTGVISGSSNKAIEFDSLGNILTLTTGSAVEHNVLAYDGTKWVASASLGSGTSGVDNDAVASMFVSGSHTNISFEHDNVNDVLNATVSVDDAITVTYAPSPIYARISVSTNYTLTTSPSGGTVDAQFDTEDADTSPNSDMVDLTNNQLVVPAGVSKVRITSNLSANDPDIVSLSVVHKRSGSGIGTVIVETAENSYSGFNWMSGISKIVDVQQGDTFNARVNTITGTSVIAIDTYLEMEVVEGSILNTTVNTTIPDMMTVTYQPSPVYATMAKTSSQNITNSLLPIEYNEVRDDTSPGGVIADTTNHRMVIPAGVDKVKLSAAFFAPSTHSGDFLLYIIHYDSSGTQINSSPFARAEDNQANDDWLQAFTSIISVNQGEYFEARALSSTGYTFGPTGSGSGFMNWFTLEVVEGSILNTTVNSTISDFTADTLTLSEGVISGSSNKAIEFDSLGNITTLTTGSAVEHNVLAYDGTKWVASASLGSGASGVDNDAVASMFVSGSHTNISFEHDEVNDVLNASVSMDDAITVTYSPSPVYARINLSANISNLLSANTFEPIRFDEEDEDTSPDSNLVSEVTKSIAGSNRTYKVLSVPAGVTKVKLSGTVHAQTAGTETRARILQYDSSNTLLTTRYTLIEGQTSNNQGVVVITEILSVNQGDYFEIEMDAGTNSYNIYASYTWFEMEVVEGSVLNTTVNSTISDFTADTLTLSEGVISGSNNKAIEFDADGNILTLTTGSVSTNDVLKYDGTKWIADTLQDAMTVTYAPSPVYAKIYLNTTVSSGFSSTNYNTVPFDTEMADTSPNSDMVDLVNNRLVVPAGVTKVKIKASAHAQNSDSNIVLSRIRQYRGGVELTDTITTTEVQDNDGGSELPSSFTGIIEVQQGDEFDYALRFISTTGYSIRGVDLDPLNRTWMEMEVVEGSILNTTVNTTIPDMMSVTYSPNVVHARMTQSSNQSMNTLVYNTIQYDTIGIDTSPSSNLTSTSNYRFIIPIGVSKVKLRASLHFATATTVDVQENDLVIYKNGAMAISSTANVDDSNGANQVSAFTGIIDVVQGDYFEVKSYGGGQASSTNASSPATWFEIEVVEGSILNTTVNSTISDFTADTLTLSEGVISGSNNKAIEFDSLGNILTLTTGSAVEHNVLAYDGTKWVASGSLGSGGGGSSVSTVNDILPLTFTSGGSGDILDLVSNKYYIYNDTRNWPNSPHIKVPNSTNSSNGDTIVIRNIRSGSPTGGTALRILGNTGVTVLMPNGSTYSGSTTDPRLPSQSTAIFKHYNNVWYVTFDNSLPMRKDNFSDNDVIYYDSNTQSLYGRSFSEFYTTSNPYRLKYVTASGAGTLYVNEITNEPQIVVYNNNTTYGAGTEYRVTLPDSTSSSTPVNGTRIIVHNIRTQTAGGNNLTIRTKAGQSILKRGSNTSSSITLKTLDHVEMVYWGGYYYINHPLAVPFDLGISWQNDDVVSYNSSTASFTRRQIQNYNTYNSRTATFTAAVKNYYSVTTSGSDIVVNLPSASSTSAGERIEVKFKSGSDNVIITPNGSDTVESSSNFIMTTSSPVGQSVTLVCDGSSNWEII